MIQYINKLLCIISLSCLIVPELYAQPELISNGGFEDYHCFDITCSTNPNAICCPIQCTRGDFGNVVTYNATYDFGWRHLDELIYMDRHQAELFDRRWDRDLIDPFSSCDMDKTFGIPENFYTDDLGSPIEHHGGSTAGNRYAGLQGGQGIRNDAIAYKFRHPIKANTIYTLRFYAHNAGNGEPTLSVRLGPENDWSQGVVHHEKEIEGEGWQLVELEFFVFDCDVDWMMIRIEAPANPVLRRRVMVDDFSMKETCKEICSATYGNLIDNVYSNNIHTATNPLTFFNLDDVKEFELQIFPVTAQSTPIRTIFITNPASKVSWDGKNDNGVRVANANYTYRVKLGNDCRCREFTGAFSKQDDYSQFNITGSNYQGALLFYNLHNVTRAYVRIKAATPNGPVVREFEIINPRDNIIWDGRNDLGADVAFGTYTWELTASNICGTEFFTGDFTKFIDVDANDPAFAGLLDYSPVPKPAITCPFNYNYSSFSRPPKACCIAQPDLYIFNRDIEGQWDYILIHGIIAGPDVTIKSGSDVLFQAGFEVVLLPGFDLEPATIFDAVIDDCTPTEKTGNPGDGADRPATARSSTHDPDIVVYPNPGEGQYVLELVAGGTPLFVQVTDVFGTAIREYPTIRTEKLFIDITGSAPGVYFIKAIYPDGKRIVKKIIHQ